MRSGRKETETSTTESAIETSNDCHAFSLLSREHESLPGFRRSNRQEAGMERLECLLRFPLYRSHSPSIVLCCPSASSPYPVRCPGEKEKTEPNDRNGDRTDEPRVRLYSCRKSDSERG